MTIMLGILLVLMLAYYNYAQKQLSLLTLHRNQVAEKLSMLQSQLKQTALLHTPKTLNKALLVQISQLEQKEAMQQQILKTINQSSATPDKGYAALMRAFAKQSLDGLWLTSFSIDSQTEQLNISGRTLQADFVPEYITRLGKEPVLKGKSFASLNMRLAKTEALATNNSPSEAIPPISDTIIKNSKTSIPVNTVVHVNEKQANEPKYIEFSLQSTEVKSASNIQNTKLGEKS